MITFDIFFFIFDFISFLKFTRGQVSGKEPRGGKPLPLRPDDSVII